MIRRGVTSLAFLAPVVAAVLLLCGAAGVRAEEEAGADANDAAVKAAMDVFRSSYRGDDDAKVNALEAVAEIKHPKVFALLGGILCGKESETIRATAARGLGSYHDKRAVPFLLKGFEANKKDTKVLEVVIKGLGETGDIGVADDLGKFATSKGPGLDKKTIDAVYMAVDTLGKLPCKSAIADLIKLGDSLGGLTNLDGEKQGMRNELLNRCIGSLRDLSGEDLKGDDSSKIIAEYKKWWKANEKTWDPNKKKSS